MSTEKMRNKTLHIGGRRFVSSEKNTFENQQETASNQRLLNKKIEFRLKKKE